MCWGNETTAVPVMSFQLHLWFLGSGDRGTDLSPLSVPTPRNGPRLPTQHHGQIQICLLGSGYGLVPLCHNKSGIDGEINPKEMNPPLQKPLPLSLPVSAHASTPRAPSPSPCPSSLTPETAAPSHLCRLGASGRQIRAQHLLSAPLHLCRCRML